MNTESNYQVFAYWKNGLFFKFRGEEFSPFHGQRKKDSEGSLPKNIYLATRSKAGEDNLRESMPVDADTLVDTLSHLDEAIITIDFGAGEVFTPLPPLCGGRAWI